MQLTVIRFSSGKESTLGLLLIDEEFACYTLEDEKRTVKVYGETRIPEGRYRLGLRKEGGHHNRYSKKFGALHKGMLHILDVPNFEYILIHIGNDDDDTEGCLLVGDISESNVRGPGRIGQSTAAYKRIYEVITKALQYGEEVWIEIQDLQGRKNDIIK